MASNVVVIDTSFRRYTVKVTPGKYMTEVLEEACSKFGINASNYGLKNNNKTVDLSRTFRQTGLTTGAKLELVVASKTPTVVSVALQLPESLASTVPGGRLTEKVPSNTTLWLILRKLESTKELNLNFTARGVLDIENGASGAGRVLYEMPVLNIMGRELCTFGHLQKTLAQLGFNGGSILIRLAFKKTDQPLEEAMAEIGQYFNDDALEAAEKKTAADPPPKEELDTVTDAIASLPSDEHAGTKDVEMASNNVLAAASPDLGLDRDTPIPALVTPSKRPALGSQEEVLSGPDGRPISVFSAPSSETPLAALRPYIEADYQPTIADVKRHQSRLLNGTVNKRLPSDAETERAEKEKSAKLAATKEISIKIRFPDESTIVSPFKADETGADLYKYVAGVIVAKDQPFKLVWNNRGPQTVPKDKKKKLIKNLGFEGRVLVNFLWEDGASQDARNQEVLKEHLRIGAKEITVPDIVGVESKEEDGPSTAEKGKGKDTEGGGGKSGKGKGGMPAWFKGIAKK